MPTKIEVAQEIKPESVQGSEEWMIEQERKRKERVNNPLPGQKPEDVIAPGSDIYNLHTKRKHLINEVHWSFANYHAILQAAADGRGRDIALMPKVRNEPILCIGSGPTLDRALPRIKEWEGDVICSPSQASTLVYWGKDPKYILALDPDETPPPMAVDSWHGRDTTLLIHPGTNPWLISPQYFKRSPDGQIGQVENKDAWPGKFGFFRKMEPQTPFYANAQKMGYSDIVRDVHPTSVTMHITAIIGTEIVMLGCVANAEIFVASLLGYNPIYLVGVDFGYPGGQDRFTKWTFTDGKWTETKSKMVEDFDDQQKARLVMSDAGIQSEEIHMFYKRNFMSAWRLEKMQIITVEGGCVTETPQVSWETLLKRQGVMGGEIKGFNKREIVLVSEQYLARQNTHVIAYQGGGIQFTEFGDGVKGVYPYLQELRRRGVQNLDWNATVKGIKDLARTGTFSAEDTKMVESWEYEQAGKQVAIDTSNHVEQQTAKVMTNVLHGGTGATVSETIEAQAQTTTAGSDIQTSEDAVLDTIIQEVT